jgi:hypothetical protein
MRLPNNVNNLIEVLKDVQKKYGNQVPISINLIGNKVLGIQNICIDNQIGADGVQVLIEADLGDKAEFFKEFDVYTTGEELEDEDESVGTFETDLEKMVDLLEAIMSEDNASAYDEFLRSYSYLTENELDDTVGLIDAEVLADLYRQAENYYIEELNGRPTGLAITSDIAKSTIVKYVYDSGLVSKAEQKEFEELCQSMAC